MRILISVILIILLFINPLLVFGETKIFFKQYTYQASELDSKVSCRIIALEQVKRLLLEEIGTYILSISEVNNYRLTKDQVIILSAGVVSAEIVHEDWTGIKYTLKAKLTADPEQVLNSINELRNNFERVRELENIHNRSTALLNDLKQIREDPNISKYYNERGKIYNQYINSLSAADYRLRGIALIRAGYTLEGSRDLLKAAELDPQNYRGPSSFEGDRIKILQNVKVFDSSQKVIYITNSEEIALLTGKYIEFKHHVFVWEVKLLHNSLVGWVESNTFVPEESSN